MSSVLIMEYIYLNNIKMDVFLHSPDEFFALSGRKFRIAGLNQSPYSTVDVSYTFEIYRGVGNVKIYNNVIRADKMEI